FYRAFEAEYGRGPGFRTDHLLLVTLDPTLAKYDAAQSDRFYQRLRDRAAAIPGVSSTALTSFVPLNQDGVGATAIVPDGFALPRGTTSLNVPTARIDERYFDTLGIRVLDGRGVSSTDTD